MKKNVILFALLAAHAHADAPLPARPALRLDAPRPQLLRSAPVHSTALMSARQTDLHSATIDRQRAAAALVAVATATSCGSLALLIFAASAGLPAPSRSLIAAAAVAAAAAGLEQLGDRKKASHAGRTLSEVGQAVAIASAGWLAFSSTWRSGYGSLLTPARKPVLNLATTLGCAAASAAYARARGVGDARGDAVHRGARDDAPPPPPLAEEEQPVLAPLALASAARSLAALAADHLVRRARLAAGSASSSSKSRAAPKLAALRGTAEIAAAALVVNLFWTLCTLSKWSVASCPYWGLAALAAALSVVELALSVLPDRSEARDGTLRGFLLECEVAYGAMGWWLFTLAAWRALWFDEEQQSGVWRRNADTRAAEELRRQSRINRLERHFYSLVGAFSLWGATGAALGRTWPLFLGGAGVVVTIGRVLIDSLFGEPLVLAGVLGLAAGLSLLGLVLHAELLEGAWARAGREVYAYISIAALPLYKCHHCPGAPRARRL